MNVITKGLWEAHECDTEDVNELIADSQLRVGLYVCQYSMRAESIYAQIKHV